MELESCARYSPRRCMGFALADTETIPHSPVIIFIGVAVVAAAAAIITGGGSGSGAAGTTTGGTTSGIIPQLVREVSHTRQRAADQLN
jgi:hypothetical protein